MGVYVKGMKMPSECDLCILEDHGYCKALGSHINTDVGFDTRCPLIEVPEPHGDLIDKKEVEEQVKIMQEVNGIDRGFMDVALAYAVVPTVIEAEGE